MSEDISNGPVATKDKVYAEIVTKLGQKQDVSDLYDYSPEDIVATLYELKKIHINRKYDAILNKKAAEVKNRTSAFASEYNHAVMQNPAARELQQRYDDKFEDVTKALEEEFNELKKKYYGKLKKVKEALEAELNAELLKIEGVGALKAVLDRHKLELDDGYNNDKKIIEAELREAISAIVVGDYSVNFPMKQWLTMYMNEILRELAAIRKFGSESELNSNKATKGGESAKLDASNNKVESNMTEEVKPAETVEEVKADTPAAEEVKPSAPEVPVIGEVKEAPATEAMPGGHVDEAATMGTPAPDHQGDL